MERRCVDCPGGDECPPCVNTLEDKLARKLAECKPRTNEEIVCVVEGVLKDFGFNHEHWEEMQEVKRDLVWIREARKRCDMFKGKAFGSLIGAIVTGILVLLTLGAHEWFGSK